MASAIEKKTCPVCKKNVGIATCDGCQQSFCSKHFIEHRQYLSQQMDNIGQDHDLLQRDITSQNSMEHPLFEQINRWEQESIAKVQVAAEAVRADLYQLIEKNKQDLKESVIKITNELQISRESDSYTELDIDKWIEQIRILREKLESPPTFSIDEDSTSQSFIRLISIHTRQNCSDSLASKSDQHHVSIDQNLSSSINERFNEVDGDAKLSEGGRVVTNYLQSYFFINSVVYGINQYSNGIYDLHFRIEKIGDQCIFIGITSMSGNSKIIKYGPVWCYGWWDLNQEIKGNEIVPSKGNKIIKSGDDITLKLSCDHQEIQLQHHRTNRSVQLSIPLKDCPFPWRILIKLQSRGDCLRIL